MAVKFSESELKVKKLSYLKFATLAFYPNNREAKYKAKGFNNGKSLPLCPVQTNFRVALDRSFT